MNKMIPRGIRNKNPSNIRISNQAWKGKITDNTDGVFEQFTSMEYGIRALMIILRTYMTKYKCNTIEKIIKRFAPANENDTAAYIKTVAKLTGFLPDEKLIFNEDVIFQLIPAMCKVENGGYYITEEQIKRAWEML